MKVINKTYIDNSRFMEFIDELATQITEMNYGADTFKNVQEGSYKFTDEAQEYYNDMYSEYEMMANNIMGVYSDNELNKYKVKYTQKMADNQIIAEFMGYTEKNKKIKEIYNQEAEVKSFSYHTSWDWLMPVANEIIKSRDEQNADWDLTNLKYALQTTNIEYVYKAVVEFINEYNKRK
tara:strand:- start:1175 stop:1711 length:537 start_codon:yes stop_codon:yes gene_type:complete